MDRADFRRFCEDFDVAVVVGSRDRAETLSRYTDRLLSDYWLFWSGDGYAEREYRCIERHEVPRGIRGHAAVWNYILRTLDQKVVIVMDDDINICYWMAADVAYRVPPPKFLEMLLNLTVSALDAGVGIFGISDIDIRKASPLAPFSLRSMIGCLTGIVGRGLWYDERNLVKDDYDFCLQHLKRDRFVWKDMRYFVTHDLNILPGGQMQFRTVDRELEEVKRLAEWWGEDMVHYRRVKGTMSLGFSL